MGNLVLSRRRGERIRVDAFGEVMWIEILDNRGGRTRLLFEAPACFAILRDNAKEDEPRSIARCVSQRVIRAKHKSD